MACSNWSDDPKWRHEGRSRSIRPWRTHGACGACRVLQESWSMSFCSRASFHCVVEVPTPQPNIEIRKPSIELKFTLISVTICSLIFFICTFQLLPGQEAMLIPRSSCGMPGHVGWTSARAVLSLHRWIYDVHRLRPYHDEHTRSRLITEVKHRRARIVLGWGTAWEHLVP